MKMRAILGVIAMTAVWVVLAESYQWTAIVWGALAGIVTMYFCHKFLPEAIPIDKSIKIGKLIFYPFYLIFQIYKGAVGMVIFTLRGKKKTTRAIVVHTTQLKSETLKVILAGSITLVPGSATIHLPKRENSTSDKLLCLFAYDKKENLDEASEEKFASLLVGSLEETLLKMERRN